MRKERGETVLVFLKKKFILFIGYPKMGYNNAQ